MSDAHDPAGYLEVDGVEYVIAEAYDALLEASKEKDNRIAELETLHRETVEEINAQGHGRFITEADIDKAWRKAEQFFAESMGTGAGFRVLELIHIIACPRCGGSGTRTRKEENHITGISITSSSDCPACNRNGKSHGWVWQQDKKGAEDGGEEQTTGA